MEEVGLLNVENYVSRLHNIVAQFITTRKIMGLCLAGVVYPAGGDDGGGGVTGGRDLRLQPT